MADPFRTSKDVLGGVSVTRKGSKYDQDSNAYAKHYPIPNKPEATQSMSDSFVASDLKAAQETAQEHGTPAEGPALYDRFSGTQRFNHDNKGYMRK